MLRVNELESLTRKVVTLSAKFKQDVIHFRINDENTEIVELLCTANERDFKNTSCIHIVDPSNKLDPSRGGKKTSISGRTKSPSLSINLSTAR